jgi:two-component sensor histidine kinase
LIAGFAQPLLSRWTGVGLPPFITFYPAVVAAALAGGPRVGVVTALASLAIAWWFFMGGLANLLSPSVYVPILIYLVTSNVLGWTVGSSRLALDSAVVGEQLRITAARESIHRTKNLLAVVQAIVCKIYREVGSREQYRDVLVSRLAALGNAQDVLIQRDWVDLPVGTLVNSALAPFLPNPGLILQAGPKILVPAKHMAGLCMALFELATNSMKYGALVEGRGKVVLSWRVDDGDAVLEWDEKSEARAGQREGFGVKLIRAALNDDAHSRVCYRQDAGGVYASFRWRDPRI